MRRACCLALLVAAAAVTTAAYAANVVPNPGFETDCTGVPCNWTTVFTGTVTRDTTFTPHADNASLKLVADSGATATSVLSDCFLFSAGQHALSYWFNFQDVRIPAVTLDLLSYSSTNCSGIQLNPQGQLNGTVGDGFWQQASGTVTAPTGTQSARIGLLVNCAANSCAGGETAHFDDVNLDSAVTAVVVRSLTAVRVPYGVRLTWRASAQPQLVGFNAYRGAKRLTHLIAAKQAGSATYTFVDRLAPRGRVRYRLQLVYADGARAWSEAVTAG
jgi:hypothetical protein